MSLELGFRIPDSVDWSESGFLELYSGFNEQKPLGFCNPDSLTSGEKFHSGPASIAHVRKRYVDGEVWGCSVELGG